MKKIKERIVACFLVALMLFSVLVLEPVQTKAATTYTVTSLEELKTALENAVDGDVINVGEDFNYSNIILDDTLTITKDITINFVSGAIDYYDMTGEAAKLEALVVIDSCDVTISGSGQVGTAYNDIYAYKLVDTGGDASLTFDSSAFFDDGVLIVDNASNNYTSKLTINAGSYAIPTERESEFEFSNGTENSDVPKANLIINGGYFEEKIDAYIGTDMTIIDHGEESGCRYEVRSTVMSDQFKKMLTDGKIIVPSVEPKEEMEEYAYLMGFLCMYETEDVYYYPERISDGVYDIAGWMQKEPYDLVEVHRVEVVFDAEINSKELEIAKDVVEKIPYESESWEWEGEVYENRWSNFLISDMEAVNMWASGYDRDNTVAHRHTVNYSSELKEYLKNSNVDFRVTMIGAGMDTDLYLEACGEAVILINDIMYANVHTVRAQVKQIVYVPDGTATDKDSLMAAAQKRINEYLGSDSKVKITYGGAYNTLSNTWWNEDDEAYQAEMMEYLGLETAPEHYFIATSGDMQYKFLIMADSSKMITPTYKTVDASSNVSISSDAAEIPLDTSMRANQLTSGEEYDKVIETLGVEENVTFDLKLYSQSTASYVSKLETGKFEVQIPITETLKDKDLVAYYVDENGEVVEYEVTVKDGCAVFATDHFSIYTIAEKTVVVPPTPPTPEVVAPEDNAGGSTFEEKAETVVEKVPFTEEEKAQIEAGAEIKITLDVKDITETVSKEDKAKVEAEVEEVKDQKVGMYLDVNMFKQVGSNEAVKVPELSEKVKIQFTVPDTLLVKDEKMNREYSVIRVHEGVTTVLDAKFDAETKTLVFETDSFSTYALVYKDVPKTPVSETPDTEIPDTGDHTYLFAWFMLFAVGGCAITFGIKSKKQY